MKDIRDSIKTTNDVSKKVMQGELRYAEMKEVLDMAKECGATEGSVEYFMATQLFARAKNRDAFRITDSKEGRYSLLQWWCKKEGYY